MAKATTISKQKASPAKGKATAGKKKADSPKKESSKPADQVILEVMATLYKRGNKAPDKKKVTSLSRLNSKTFMNNITKLKKAGLLEVVESTYQLTEKGVEKTKSMTMDGGSNEEVQQKIREKLKGKAPQLFDILLDGKEHDKDEVARQLGYEAGKKQKTFMNLTAILTSEGIAFYPSRDTIQLVKEACFPYDE